MKKRLTILLIIALAVGWGLFAGFQHSICLRISSRLGERILARGDGKFADVQRFIQGRLTDGMVLLTAACLTFLTYRGLAAWIGRRFQPPGRWVVQGWIAFICLNLFVAIATHTVLFWCGLYTGKENVENYTQWHVKSGLMAEVQAPSQAVLLGTSQTRAEIDTKVLNKQLGRQIWTTELHFPGSSPYDMILCLERIPKKNVSYLVTYVSEPMFYGASDNGRLMYFFGFRDLPYYWSLGPGRPDCDRYMICGLLGDVFPLYHVWEPLVARARGKHFQNEGQQAHDASLERDLVERARRNAKGFAMGPRCASQKKAFLHFARMCRERGSRLIICCGQLNPILERALDPVFRQDMLSFLHRVAAADPNIIILDDSQMPCQVESDYEDLTHVNAAARARFSTYMAGVLENLTHGVAVSQESSVQR